MKIGMIFDDTGLYDMNFKHLENGNPGISGTHYCFLQLAYYLKVYEEEIDIMVYHFNENKFSDKFHVCLVESNREAIKNCKKDNVDILIFKCNDDPEMYRLLDYYKVKGVAWAHNYIITDILKDLCSCQYLKRVIFVGRQQYDRYIDHSIIKKSQFIFNMFPSNNNDFKRVDNYENIVTYTGALIPQKGFHIMAKEWKKIIKKVPDAKLYVLGSGQLYSRDSELGTYKIASQEYENIFMRFLTDENGKILDSVKFLGTLGEEKVDIYNKTAVGVVNPSARTETFCISAVEMEACGVPIVSKKKNGLPDTIINKSTGYLVYSKRQFRNSIINLLKIRSLNNQFSINAKIHVNNFLPEVIIQQWQQVFYDIMSDIPCRYIKPCNYYLNNIKILRIMNKNLKHLWLLKKLPALVEYEIFFRKILMKMKK